MIQPTKHLKFRKKDQSVGASILHRKENKGIMGDKGKEKTHHLYMSRCIFRHGHLSVRCSEFVCSYLFISVLCELVCACVCVCVCVHVCILPHGCVCTYMYLLTQVLE